MCINTDISIEKNFQKSVMKCALETYIRILWVRWCVKCYVFTY